MVIKDFTMVFSLPNFSSAHSLCFNRIGTFKPVDDIQVMDMLFVDMITTKPVKVVPVSHLVFHFCLSGFSLSYPNAIIVPPSIGCSNFSNHVFPLVKFPVGIYIVTLKSNHHIQFLFLCFFCCYQNSLYALRIGCNWLLHENMLVLPYRLFKMNRS